jgi:hypothetical protein
LIKPSGIPSPAAFSGHSTCPQLAQQQAKLGNDSEIMAFAAKTLPLPELHLEMAHAEEGGA